MTSNTDKIYSQKLANLANFKFDEKVAEVFPDMLNRSIPGYPAIITMIETLTARFGQNNSNFYDLGCSLGASSHSMQLGNTAENCKIVAIDNSKAMIEKCLQNPQFEKSKTSIEFKCEDIVDSKIENASIVVLNFTLQFVAPESRLKLIKTIYDGMLSGGILILSEKVCFEDEKVNSMLIDVYHSFKKANGYSDLEISQKRTALEKVLIPESFKRHRDRLIRAGFESVEPWFQCFNFMSILAVKK